MYRFAYGMTNSRDDAEDVVQEAFVRAYQNLHRYRDEAKFTTWILRIVTNPLQPTAPGAATGGRRWSSRRRPGASTG